MNTELSIDEIRTALRDYFTDEPGIDEIRRILDKGEMSRAGGHSGFNPEGWTAIAGKLGLAGLGAPEALGGLELDFSYLTAAVEECGASLYPGPARAAALTGWSLRQLRPEQIRTEIAAVLERFLEGSSIPGLPGTGITDSPVEYVDGLTTGRLPTVTHGMVAELVVCEVRTPEGPAVALLVIPDDATRDSVPTIDLSTPRADIIVEGASTLLLTEPSDAEAISAHDDAAHALLAAEQVGGAEGCLSRMVEYAKVRSQFDQPIGSYQAIQHRCAQTAVATVASRALVSEAAGALDAGRQNLARPLATLARAEAGDCFISSAESLIQVSGGIGFTWEHDAHLFFRRARTLATLGGTPDQHRTDAVRAGCIDLLTTKAS